MEKQLRKKEGPLLCRSPSDGERSETRPDGSLCCRLVSSFMKAEALIGRAYWHRAEDTLFGDWSMLADR